MDSSAFNYDDTACYDDSSCIAVALGCTDSTAVNYDPFDNANTDDGSCCYESGCTDSNADNYNANACYDDGACAYTAGCMDNEYAEFYNQDFVATVDDDSCITIAIFGCTQVEFANYNSDANVNQGCEHIFGCMDSTACNYDSSASFDNGTCVSLSSLPSNSNGIYYDCEGDCINDSDGDGVCDELEISGCSDFTACNYGGPTITDDDGSCNFATLIIQCNGSCWLDEDSDGVCDQEEIIGCQDAIACNYDETATDSGDCTYAETYYNCDGVCVVDTDSDGVCDELEILGCTDSEAFNYNETATDDDDSCDYAIFGCTDLNYAEYNETATDDDGTCVSLIGCLDTSYYEYNSNVIVSNSSACESKIGDANGDNSINLTDLFLVLDNWLQVTELGQNGDVNPDGIVNLTDLFDVLDNWLQ